MNLNRLAKKILPASLYDRLVTSSVAKRLAHGSMWGLIGSASSRIMVLVGMILVARILGKVSFGELGVIQNTLGVAGLMAGAGLGATGTRFLAHYATDDPERAGRIIGMLRLVSISTVVIAVSVLLLAAHKIASTALSAPHLTSSLMLGSVLMAVYVFRGIQNGSIAGLEKFDLIAKLNIFEGVIALIAMIVLANLYGVEGALMGLAVGAGASWLAGIRALNRLLALRSIVVSYQNCLSEWRILSSYSLPSFLASLVATPVLWYCMTMVARGPNGYADMGIYNAAYQWHGPMIFLPMIIMSTSLPILVKEWVSGNHKHFLQITSWISAMTLAVAVPPAAIVALLSPWVMSTYGEGFSEGWPIMVLILAAAPFHALSKIATGALLGMHHAWRVLGLNLVWAIVMITTALQLIPLMNAKGLAIAFLAAYATQALAAVILVLVGSRQASNKTHLEPNE